jgi:hypothetical protein
VKVQIEVEVLNQPKRFGRDIAAILDRCDHGQHQWFIENLDHVLESAWMKGRASWDVSDELARKTYRAQFDEPIAQKSQRLLVVCLGADPSIEASIGVKRESPYQARRILEQALNLILENGTADWQFICAMSRTYPREFLSRAIAKGWILPDHAGGKGEFKKRFDQLRDRGIPPWRIVVLMDSDRLTRGPLPEDNEKKREQLEALGVRVFVLFKRETENYLPSTLLQDERHASALAAFCGMGLEQRDYCDMKKAFSKRIGERFREAQISRDEMDSVCSTFPGEIEEILRVLEEML